MKAIIVLLAIMAGVLLALPASPRNDAYTICMKAHSEIDGTSEEACAEALDKAGAVFLCNKTGETCWIERI